MNSDNKITDEDLGRWLNGDLTNDEFVEFKKTEEYHTYKIISEYSDNLIAPDFDTKNEFALLESKLAKKSDRTRTFNLSWLKTLSVAASIALLFGGSLLYYFNKQSNFTKVYTAQGGTKTITLPNQSIIDLNGASEISYNGRDWDKERAVNLKGEAYFKVTKGNRFKVNTNQGYIEVLGTEFNIRNRLNTTEVICYSGKVRVTDLNNENVELTENQSVLLVAGKLQTDWTLKLNTYIDWKQGVSSFHQASLNQVIEELQNQYNITVINHIRTDNRVYTGAFPHDNMEEALSLVFTPLQIKYRVNSNGLILLE